MKRSFVFIIIFLFSLSSGIKLWGQQNKSDLLSEGLVIKLNSENNIIAPDPLSAAILSGSWNTPSENQEFHLNGGLKGTWKKIQADTSGWFIDDSLINAYIYFSYKSDNEKVILLEAMGNTMVYVNGTPRSGNPYRAKDTYESWEPRFDYSLIPVKIKKGINELLFQCNRGVLKVKLNSVGKEILLNKEDLTVPDLIINQEINTYGALPVVNTTEKVITNLFIKTWSDSSRPDYFKIENLQPLSIYKTPFTIKLPPQSVPGKLNLNIQVVSGSEANEKVLADAVVILKVVQPEETHKETFISQMDGSVQYYAVNPPKNLTGRPALFLSLHGAGVEAINQANSYAHKNWGFIVAPTNRRPYGFNWENWGRLDALEVLDISKKKFGIDLERVYLTGHSMGGHGTWHLGVNYPDKFAAIGPSAGWISIWSYRIKPDPDSTEAIKMLIRSSKQSDTYSFAENLKSSGVYIIHGSADDNVPPQQAYSMIEVLSKFHKDFVFHEEPGAGHWWDNSEEPGADCVDWAPMFDFFAHHSVPSNEMISEIDFTTANPAVASERNWIRIINQVHQQKLSRIKIKLEPGLRKFTAETENVELFEINAAAVFIKDTLSVEIDKQLITGLTTASDGKIYLKITGDKWNQTETYSSKNKYPARCGNIREALNNDVIFVYGTKGNSEENKWAFDKARYDAERLWYQGNGSIEVIEDIAFDPERYRDRNVILFGNSETNSAWSALIKNPEIQVSPGKVKFGQKEYKGNDIACLFIFPRLDSKFASVAVISGTGITGMKLAGLPLYHHPYSNYPDIMVFNKNITTSDDEGILLTGYFGNDWSIERGDFIAK